MQKKAFYLASLGCAKNTVDSESIASLLQSDGFCLTDDPGQASILIVNTCGFIQPARLESLQVLGELAQQKKTGQLLIAAGCLTDRYRDQILQTIPGVDGMISTRRWMDILDLVHELRSNPKVPRYHLPNVTTIGTDEHGVLRASIQGTSAYLKIADGCRRPCAFCSIPLIKGTAVSRPIETIVREAKTLQDAGIRELILIAQDTTDYGSDAGLKDGLTVLLENMLPKIPSIPWVRLLYAYPGFVSNRLIDLMSSSRQILSYLDIPLQHADPELLKKMKRPSNMDWVRKTIRSMREKMPDLALRTTFIVGYPGETQKAFETLLQFIKEIEFDHVGVFPYSFETGTTAEPYGDPISEKVKQERVEQVMLLQERISLKRNQLWIGKKLDVLVEGEGDGISVGRSFRDAPEIDGLVIIEGKANVGEIYPVQVSGAMAHDLTGFFAK